MKRGTTNLSMVIAVDKPTGMTSHDVVSRARRIFGEKRVGHTGTLDPLASGVLPLCIGPATRLDQYLTNHDKSYVVSVVFGEGTDTDDCDGEVIKTGEIPEELFDPFFATAFVQSLIGPMKQLPPVYSAIKVGGVKACDAARKGRIIDLTPRDIEVFQADLLGIYGADGLEKPRWDISFKVSKGTYIRSLARDMGNALGCPAHVGALRRTAAGAVTLHDCVSLDVLEELKERAALDPVRLLGVRFSFVDEESARRIHNGNPVSPSSLTLCEKILVHTLAEMCACTSGIQESIAPLHDKELIALVTGEKLLALYEYREEKDMLVPACVFSVGVKRGSADL